MCSRCTKCCKWPGDVRLREGEVEAIAAYLEMDESVFIERYTRLTTQRDGLSLIEKPNDHCIMLEGDACRIQSVKPQQCKDFPNRWNFPGWREVCCAVPVRQNNRIKE